MSHLFVARRRATLLTAVAVLALSAVSAGSAVAAATSPATSGATYHQLDLVSDVPGAASLLDANLVNPWGLSASPTGPLWVSNNGSNTSTLYSGATSPGQPASIVPLVVTIPGGGAPTGQIYNNTNDFVLPTGGPAAFVFSGENGDLAAWNGAQSSHAVVVSPSTGGVYKGLALVSTTAGNRLLAADFHDNRIDVFDGTFHRVASRNAFVDPTIPAGYAPFDVALLGGLVYVTYAKQDAAKHDDVAGPGNGFIDTYAKNGHLVARFANRGALNSPWGLAIAPPGFGRFAGAVLVGNFGDGRIHAFASSSGSALGVLRGTGGTTLVIDGLWGLLPGNGTAGATSDVWFSAGPAGESHGLLGILRANG